MVFLYKSVYIIKDFVFATEFLYLCFPILHNCIVAV